MTGAPNTPPALRDESKRDKQHIENAEAARDPLWAPDPGDSKWWGEEREMGDRDER
jgi:hypothetical protein